MPGLNFSLEHTKVVINGHTVQGWSEDGDALSLPDVELASVTRGADGQMLATSTGNRGGQVTLNLLANSKSTQFFMEQASRIRQGAVVEFQGTINNQDAGVSVQLERGVMTQSPFGQSQGKGSASSRQFMFEFETINMNYSGAKFNPPPPVTDA